MRLIDRTGLVYDKLTVTGRGPNTPRGHTQWYCTCICGTKLLRLGSDLPRRGDKSCAKCASEARVTHGMSDTRVHNIWVRMVQRTTNENCDDYTRYGYGLLGIDPSWLKFEVFFADMGEPPTNKHSIDRIDGTKGYSKDNCRWATPSEQARNKSSNILVEYQGQSLCLAEWCEKLNLPYLKTWQKLYTRKLSVEEAFKPALS